MADAIVSTPVVAGGFSDAISRILNHTGVPRPKRIKREKPDDLDRKPLISASTSTEPVDPDEHKDVIKVEKSQSQKTNVRGKRLSKEERDPWHVLPEVTERDRERKLAKIATKGVVQLFNAVRAQQSSLEEKLEEAGPSFRKSEQVLKSVSKGDFLDLLKNPSGSVKIRKGEKTSGFYEDEAPKRWEVLDDEYMTKSAGDSDDGDADSSGNQSDSDESLEEVF